MKTRGLTMMLLILASILFLLGADTPENTTGSSGGGIDWFEVMMVVGYIGGVFVLLPLVIFTNLKEKLYEPTGNETPLAGLDEDARNERAETILERIWAQLTPFEDEEGNEVYTITTGKQAKFVKYGLDYINMHLIPSDPILRTRLADVADVYNNRAQRAFTGSNWIIGASAGLGLFMFFMGGIQPFLFIHFLGLAFYILSSRTTFYTIEKRMERFGNLPGFLTSVMSGLFLANGAKHYMKEGDGPWKRDYEAEFTNSMMTLLFLFVAAMILGFMAAFVGVINFVLNYATSFINPLENEVKWFDKHFAGLESNSNLEPA